MRTHVCSENYKGENEKTASFWWSESGGDWSDEKLKGKKECEREKDGDFFFSFLCSHTLFLLKKLTTTNQNILLIRRKRS